MGVEPTPLAGQDPKSCVAASYTTGPKKLEIVPPKEGTLTQSVSEGVMQPSPPCFKNVRDYAPLSASEAVG